MAAATLAVTPDYQNAASAMNMRPNVVARCGGGWVLTITTPPLCVAGGKILSAFLDRLDGGVETALIPMQRGWLSNSPDVAPTTLSAAAPLQGDKLTVSGMTGQTIRAGSLFTVSQNGKSQLFDVLDTVEGAATTELNVWPRVGTAFTAGAVVTWSPVPQWHLVDDKQAAIARSPRAEPHTIAFRELIE